MIFHTLATYRERCEFLSSDIEISLNADCFDQKLMRVVSSRFGEHVFIDQRRFTINETAYARRNRPTILVPN